MNRMNRRVTVVVAAAATVPLLAGCYNGFNAQTDTQGPSGDGTSAEVGNLQIRSATWVRSAKDLRTMTMSASFVNPSKEADVLESVTTDPKAFVIGITGGTIELKPTSKVRVGFNSDVYVNGYGVDAVPSGYVSTTFTFKNAGAVTIPLLTVAPIGIYAGIEPNPPAIGQKATPRATATPSASPSESASPTVTVPPKTA
ncbi:MAG: hypothetical protein ACOYD0_07375 [Candidatus Nanopelagicales bacterium]